MEQNKKMTAVEYLMNKLYDPSYDIKLQIKYFEEAKQMEKEQIMKAVDRGFDEGCKHPEDITLKDAEQYYNETYGKE
jgi:hypothetical protein